jgi:predicted nucleic acid-binding Zn finger protein
MKHEAMIYIDIFKKNSYILVQFSDQCQSYIVVFAFTLHCCMDILALTHAVITMMKR